MHAPMVLMKCGGGRTALALHASSPWKGEPLGGRDYRYRVDRSRCCWVQRVWSQWEREASE